MRNVRVGMAAVVAAAVALGAGRWARAEGLADHMPADAMVYLEWPGTDALGSAYSNSNLKGIIDALQVRQRIEAAIQQKGEDLGDEGKAKAEMARQWIESVAKNPGAVYVGPVDFSGDSPMPKVAVVSKVGASQAQAMASKAKEEMDKQEAKEGAPPVSIVVSGDYVVMNVGKGVTADKWLTTPPAESLGASDKYKKAMAQAKVKGTAAGELYIDGETAVQAMMEGMTRSNEDPVKNYGPIVLDALGLSAVRQMAWQGAFDGKNWASRGFVGLEGERKGLLGLFDFPNLRPADIAMIPGSAAWAQVGRFDGNRVLDDVRAAIVKINPQGGQQFDMVVRQAYAFTGVDVQKDLFASLGDTFAMYAVPDADGKITTITVANKAKDPAKLEQALTGLETFANQMMAQRGGAGMVSITQEPLAAPNDKITAHLIKTPVGTGAWTIADGVLYISGGKDALEKAVSVKGGGLAEGAKFTAVKQQLGAPGMGGFQYDDVAAVGPGYWDAFKKQWDQLIAQADVKQPPLPAYEQLKPYMGTGLMVWWMDGAGLHAAEEGPFPGWNAINPVTEIAGHIQEKLTTFVPSPAPGQENPAGETPAPGPAEGGTMSPPAGGQ
ncbi:MAG TPA: hypothetical protein VH253_17105 [Phycisphaerae bacterium]|nr:hypothetical protein [Phycisphaerae bacterium]